MDGKNRDLNYYCFHLGPGGHSINMTDCTFRNYSKLSTGSRFEHVVAKKHAWNTLFRLHWCPVPWSDFTTITITIINKPLLINNIIFFTMTCL